MSETSLFEQSDHTVEWEAATHWPLHEELSEMLAIVSAIPDGISLASFPSHVEGPDCWCRPKVTFSADAMIVSHKDLSQGDFDS
jgi:hypothetical protein